MLMVDGSFGLVVCHPLPFVMSEHKSLNVTDVNCGGTSILVINGSFASMTMVADIDKE